MSNPLAYLPLALAGADGALNGVPVRRLVAAGVALLQRSAPLVRTLSGHRSAILLPPGSPFLVALAASEGRGALLLDPTAATEALDAAMRALDATAVFTLEALASRLAPAVPVVLLDGAPASATWRSPEGHRTIDLTMHGGLHLTGEADEPGADEEVLVALPERDAPSDRATALTHRDVLARAVDAGARERLGRRDHTLLIAASTTPFALVTGLVAPLLVGGRVTTRDRLDAAEGLLLLEKENVSGVVAPAAAFAALLDALTARGRPLDAPVLQRCVAGADGWDEGLAQRWHAATGTPLRPGA